MSKYLKLKEKNNFLQMVQNHMQRMLQKNGIDRHFNDIFDIVSADFIPKPSSNL